MPNLLNGIPCDGFKWQGKDSVEFSLTCTYDEAASVRAPLVVTDGGETVASFEGMEPMGVWPSGDSFRLRASRELGEASAGAIHALEDNLSALSTQVTATDAKADEAKTAADEAKTAAEQAGTDPQLQALAKVQVATMDLSEATCDEVVAFRDYWPEWQPDTVYKHNQPLTYQCRYFRASKDLTSQAIYPPGTAESEYYEVELAEDGIIIWYEVGGEYNMVHKGEKRHYPDESGPVYEALEDTSYSPDAYPQHWKKLED